jgi:hypothetical protein
MWVGRDAAARLGAARPLLLVLMLVTAAMVVVGTPGRSEAATGTVYVRGSVTCPVGQPFAGAWVNSSAGGSAFADKRVHPGTGGRMARVSRRLDGVRLPTTVSLNVGCGTRGTQWRYVLTGLGKVRATGTGTVFINVVCDTSRCTTVPRGPAGPSVNPMRDSTQCTHRAAAFWRQMTGSFPSWGGDAGWWDTNSAGWAKRNWAQPDALMVWQPGPTSSRYGHVGYVADTRVVAGRTEVEIYDRNWGPSDRQGAWITVPPGAQFIRVPPRFTPYDR